MSDKCSDLWYALNYIPNTYDLVQNFELKVREQTNAESGLPAQQSCTFAGPF